MNLTNKLKNCKKLAIVGVGNEMKGDDGFGIKVIKNLLNHYKKIYPNIDENKEVNIIDNKLILINSGVVPENFTDILKKEKPTHILIIDAAIMGKNYGDIDIINPDDIDEIHFSTHSLPMSLIVKYINYYINTDVVIIGIEPICLDFGKKLSPLILKKCDDFTKDLINICDSFLNKM